MNERIQELAKQAKERVPQGIFGVDRWIEEYNKIFAELIIRDCAKLIETMDARSEPADHIYLLKAFGIKP